MKSIAIIILAAGKSSRMGNIKQLLKINGKTLLENAIETSLQIPNSSVICVLGANAEKIKKETSLKNINFTINQKNELGLSSSIVCGIKYLQKKEVNFDGILILLADQPAIKLTYYKKMATLFSIQKSKIIASNYVDKFGVPAIFPKIYVQDLLKMKGDKGAKDFLKIHEKNILSPNLNVDLTDIDTPKDYKSYISSL